MEKRNTVQKKFVIDAVIKLANHPTAEDVYKQVIKKHPSVSKATVYRNLSGLAQDGTIRHIKTPDGADRFDHNADLLHGHIVCTDCGCFLDTPAQNSTELDKFISAQTGFTAVKHEIIYSGVCPNCAKKHTS